MLLCDYLKENVLCYRNHSIVFLFRSFWLHMTESNLKILQKRKTRIKWGFKKHNHGKNWCSLGLEEHRKQPFLHLFISVMVCCLFVCLIFPIMVSFPFPFYLHFNLASLLLSLATKVQFPSSSFCPKLVEELLDLTCVKKQKLRGLQWISYLHVNHTLSFAWNNWYLCLFHHGIINSISVILKTISFEQ